MRLFLELNCKNRCSVEDGGSGPKLPWSPKAGAKPQTMC